VTGDAMGWWLVMPWGGGVMVLVFGSKLPLNSVEELST